jgi:hypothetical protein
LPSPHPGYPPPGYRPPVPRKRSALTITLLVLAILVVLCGVGGYLAARPILREYPCAWADHGSVGMLAFYNRAMDDSVSLFGSFRQAVLHRG